MHGDVGHAAERLSALLQPTKIERASDAEAAHDCDIVVRQMAKMVGTEDLSPADPAAILGGIAPEVAEIAGTGEIEVAGRCVWHGVSLSYPLRRRNEGKAYRLSGWLWSIFAVQRGANMNWCKAIISFAPAPLAAGLATAS